MKRDTLMPVRSVVLLPTWAIRGGIAVALLAMFTGILLAVYGLTTASGNELGGWLGGAFGCLVGGGGAFAGVWFAARARLPALHLWQAMQRTEPLALYRRLFRPGLVLTVLGGIVGVGFDSAAVRIGLLQPAAIVTTIAGLLELERRHSLAAARALFALYADGALTPDDAAAIDDARAKVPAFDAEVRAWRALQAKMDALMAP